MFGGIYKSILCRGGLTGLSVVKDAPQLFSSLVIMNTAVPTGFDFTDRKELLKVIAPLFAKSWCEWAQWISFTFTNLCFDGKVN